MSNLNNTLKNLIDSINKAYDSPVIMVGDDIKLNKIPTGIFSVDYALRGGIPRGRWVIAVGNESTFKSTFMYIIGGRMQRICGNCMNGFITEKSFKEVTVILDNKSNEFVEYNNGVYISKKYLADSKKRNIYVPGQKITHKKSFKCYQYEIECSECSNPDYSLILIADSEHNYTKEWAAKFDIIHGRTVLSLPNYSEQAGEIAREVLQTGRCSMIIVDSVPAIGPRIEDEKSFEDQQMGVQARVWNKIVRVATAMLNKSFTYTYKNKEGNEVTKIIRPEPILGIIQQWREKIGAYGNPNTMSGGKGLVFASSLTFEFSVIEYVYDGNKKDKNISGIWFGFILKKAKTTKPLSSGKFYFNLKTFEIENDISIIEKAIEKNIVRQSGAWYVYNDIKYQGKTQLVKKLSEMGEIDKIKDLLLKDLKDD